MRDWLWLRMSADGAGIPRLLACTSRMARGFCPVSADPGEKVASTHSNTGTSRSVPASRWSLASGLATRPAWIMCRVGTRLLPCRPMTRLTLMWQVRESRATWRRGGEGRCEPDRKRGASGVEPLQEARGPQIDWTGGWMMGARRSEMDGVKRQGDGVVNGVAVMVELLMELGDV